MTRKMTVAEMIAGGGQYFKYLTRGGLFNINLEVTKRCNARCDFCDYWRDKAALELDDYTPVVKQLKPLSVSLTGGEPLLRQDLPEIIAKLRNGLRFIHISLINNGSLLTVKRGLALWEAGLDEMSISLDYTDERHDRERGIPGLARRILDIAPQLQAEGVNLCFNMVMKRENFREIPQMLRRIARLNIKVSLSTYNGWRIGNNRHSIRKSDMHDLKRVVQEIMHLRESSGLITTGDYYLEKIPQYVSQGGVDGCTAGVNWLQVTPDGMIKRCSDHPAACHYTEWHRGRLAPTDCTQCWYSCRGAAQEPQTWKRFVEMARDAL